MKKFLSATLAVVLTLVVASASIAQEAKLAGVVATKSFDDLLKSATDIGTIVGFPGVDKMVNQQIQFMGGGQGLAGFDRTQPMGSAFYFDKENKPYFVAFLPVTNLQTLRALLPIELIDAGDGMLFLDTPDGSTVVLKPQEKWLFISTEKEHLTNLPADPLKLLGKLPEKYDFSARVHIQNIPEPIRGEAIKTIALAANAEQAATEQALTDGEDPLRWKSRAWLAETSAKAVKLFLSEVDTVELGLGMDRKTKDLSLELTTTALPNTETASILKMFSNRPSQSSGFLIEGAPFSLRFNIDQQPPELLVTAAETWRKKATEEIKKSLDENEKMSADLKKEYAQGLSTIIDSLIKTFTRGKYDGGLVVTVDPKMTFVLGGTFVNAKKSEEAFKQMVNLAKAAVKKDPNIFDDKQDFPDIHLDAKQIHGLQLHTFSVFAETEDEDQTKMFGEKINAVLAFGEDRVFLAFGENPEAVLTQVLTHSASEKRLPPVQADFSFGSMMKLAALSDDRETILLADQLDTVQGTDKFKFSMSGVPQGMKMKFTIEPGLIKLAAMMGDSLQQNIAEPPQAIPAPEAPEIPAQDIPKIPVDE